MRVAYLLRLTFAFMCSRASQKVSILVIGPWCGLKTPKEKRTREAFLSTGPRRVGHGSSWSHYVSLADCADTGCADGSHFTDEGAARILDTTLRSEITKFLNE